MPKVKLSSGEIETHAHDIFNILKEVPLFYIFEVLELAREGREKEGDIEDLDVSSEEEEEEENQANSDSSSGSGSDSDLGED